ncbi:MAG TPA: FAD-dependent oxidoreductase [Kouleothrix sp.]|uniref:dihydrolipoyl dehydrogenase family protein n=1 Tax=Kouleothrix sp. TaxID=2779161 RepID=UPI002B87CAAB|nr:FAD-dependent oxidoreductase [Kouleothrix sp.]HRC75374.1 FAD-dependent oxidoreductase [Kouleothrix sp.]
MARYTYDITIIGGGSGGLTAARLAQSLGARVALIDKERLGGDCLHYGCVPSKSLIHVAKVVQQARHAAQLGLAAAELTPDMAKVTAYVQGVIERAAQAETTYTEGVDVRLGAFEFRSAHEFTLNGVPLSSQSFIVATGSRPVVPRVEGLAEAGFLSNEQAFDLMRLPKTLTVVGGGPIGVELAQAFARLGAQVTIVQGADRVLPREDPEVAQAVAQSLERDGISIITGARMQRVRRDGDQKVVVAKQGDGEIEIRGDEILIALGRSPNAEGLNLEAAGVKYDAKGIKVDDYLQTATSNISAIGDVIGGYLFSHVAAYHAGVAVRNILVPVGKKKVAYDVLPWVTFTDPEAARIGLTEEEAMQKGAVRVIRFPYSEIDRAQAEAETHGFIKLVLGAKNDDILGAHIVGARGGELLAEIALAMKYKLGLDAIFSTTHAYPTYTTGLQQAAFEAYLESESIKSARKIIRPVLSLRG